jgi:PAS domain S-box-containing protein
MSTLHATSKTAPERPVVLLLAQDPEMVAFFREKLARDYEILLARDEAEAIAHLAERPVALIVMDDLLDGGRSAFEVRDRLVAAGHEVPMAMLTAQGNEEVAVEALRRGFMDYIVKRESNLRADLMGKRISSALEIARLKRENERLRLSIEESQARLFNVYDSLDDAIMQIDDECRVVSVNRSAAALANCEPKDAVGKVCHELFRFYPCDCRAKKESCHIYRTFLEGETIRGQREDGEAKRAYQYMTFITTLKDRDYVVYRETDVTEKRRLEEMLQQALRSLGVGSSQSPRA